MLKRLTASIVVFTALLAVLAYDVFERNVVQDSPPPRLPHIASSTTTPTASGLTQRSRNEPITGHSSSRADSEANQ